MNNTPGKPLPGILAAVVFLWPGWLGGQEKTPVAEPPPVKALLITGGASHDYTTRKEILVQGIRERVKRRIEWVVRHEGDGGSDVPIPIFQNSGWADGYNIVVHDYCFPRVTDRAYVDRILAPHRAGMPAVLVHGAMHSFRTGDDAWFEFCGATSRSHGRPRDFSVEAAPGGNAIVAGMAPWTVPRGELYLIERLHAGSTPLTLSRFTDGEGEAQATTWSHLYGPAQARVFATTLGNETPTLLTPAFLDLIAKGFLWALDDLKEESFTVIPPGESLSTLTLETPAVPLPRPGPSLVTRGRASALSVAASPLLGAENAIDGDPSSYWEADAAGPSSWQVDMRRERQVGAVMITWKGEAPRHYEVEGSRDGLSWRALLEATGQGMMPVSIGFDPRPLRFLRVSISSTDPGFVPGIREVAAYGHMDDLPAAFPDFVSINAAPRVTLNTIGTGEWERFVRLAPGWSVDGRGFLPGVEAIIQIVPTAAGEAFILAQSGGDGARSIYLSRSEAGKEITFRKFLGGLSRSTVITYDGEWIYTLAGAELNAYRDSNGDGAADDRNRHGTIYSPRDSKAGAFPTYTQFRAGPDGWFYAVAETAEDVAGFNSRHELIRFPRHGLIRFRASGKDLGVHAISDFAPDDFHFGKAAGISVQTASAPDDADGPVIRPLPPLPGEAWHDMPPLAWPPSITDDLRWGELEVIQFHHRLYLNDKGSHFPQIAEIDGMGIVALDAGRVWFSREEEGGVMLGLLGQIRDKPAPPIVWDTISTRDLFSRLSSPNRVVRTEGGFEILRRKYNPLKDLERALGSDDAGTRAVSMAVLSALGGEKALNSLITAASSSDPATQALAFHHLGDHPDLKNHPVLGEVSRTTVPAVTAAILSSMARTGTSFRGLDALSLSLVDHPDVTLATTARAFLQTRGAAAVCFEVLDDEAKEEAWSAAFAVLPGIRRATVVEDIVLRLEKTRSARFRALGIEALLVLYYDDGVLRREWEGTPLVDLFLRASLHDHRVDRAALLRGMTSAGIPAPPPATLVELAAEAIPLEAFAINVLSSEPALDGKALPAATAPWLERIVNSPERDLDLRTRALGLLAAHGAGEDYRRLFDKAVGFTGGFSGGETDSFLVHRWLSREDHLSEVSWLMQQSVGDHGGKVMLAWATILTLIEEDLTPEGVREKLLAHLNSALTSSDSGIGLASILAATPFAGKAEASRILAAIPRELDGPMPELARRTVLDRSFGRAGASDQTVGELATETLARQIPDADGDPLVGRDLFRQLACDACHNIHGEGPAIGPDLATSPKLSSLPDLIDSILVRGDGAADGDEAGIFELTGGRRLTGFAAFTGVDRVDLRDRAGNAVSLDRDEVGVELPLFASPMVCDTAALLTIDDFASLVQYLESLAR